MCSVGELQDKESILHLRFKNIYKRDMKSFKILPEAGTAVVVDIPCWRVMLHSVGDINAYTNISLKQDLFFYSST